MRTRWHEKLCMKNYMLWKIQNEIYTTNYSRYFSFNEGTECVGSFLNSAIDRSFTEFFFGVHDMIECNSSNMKCFNCHNRKGCDVLDKLMPVLTTYQNDKSLTIRIEVPQCRGVEDQVSTTLDDFLKF